MAQSPPLAASAASPEPYVGRTSDTENFPVGSWLLPADLRPTVAAYYRVARAADDIADNPSLDSAAKIRGLDALDAVLAGTGAPDVADPAHVAAARLREMLAQRNIPIEHSRHLLQAFKADAVNRPCRTWSDLLTYCRYSAAPVGRFLLDLHGEDRAGWPASDALCSALQVLNHLQDCQVDWRDLNRLYVPLDWLSEAGLTTDALLAPRSSPALRGVLDRVLDGVDQLHRTADTLPSRLRHRALRMEATAILSLSHRLERRLRRRDPVAGRVGVSKLDKLMALIYGAVRGWWR
jgi:hydroxysqualene synthase